MKKVKIERAVGPDNRPVEVRRGLRERETL